MKEKLAVAEESAEEKREKFRNKCLFEAGVTYSTASLFPAVISLILMIAVSAIEGAQESDWYVYLSYLLPQLCFAGAAAVYFLRSKEPVRASFTSAKWYYFPVALVLQFGLFVSLSQLNGYFVEFLELFGYTESETALPDLSGWNLLPAILVIALLPALCEETIFRGIISRNLRASGWGLWSAALVSGAMFSLFHGNPSQTLYQFVCGVCYALVAVRSGSSLPTMAAHFCNNAVILSLNAVYSPRFPEGFSLIDLMGRGGYIALCAVSAVCLVAAVLFLAIDGKGAKKTGVKGGKTFFSGAAIGLAVFAVEWVATLATGVLHG